ncbi:unnamed protein product, partial [Symbiodinium microadriaticum]
TWVLQLAGQAADLVKQCLSQFLDVLRGSGMVTVEKQGDLSVGQVLNIDKLLYKRLQEWEEKLKACDKIKHEKETWQRRVNDMRIEYIREIEMFRLKLRRLQKNESVSDLRDSSMKKSRNAASQTELEAGLGELCSVWDKVFEIQARMDAINQRNADFDKVDAHLKVLQEQVLAQEAHIVALEKALVEVSGAALTRQTALELAMREVQALAYLSREGRDLSLIGRDELCPRPKPAEILADLEAAMTRDSQQVLQAALKWRPPWQQTSQMVMEVRELLNALAGAYDDWDMGDGKLHRGEVSAAAAALLGRGAWPMPPNDARVEEVWNALSATQDLHDTLQAVRSASVHMRGFLQGPTESGKSTAKMVPEVTQGLQRLQTLLSSELQEEPEGSDELHEAVADQLQDRGGDDFRLEEMFVQPDGRTDSAQALTAVRPRPGSATSAETLATSDEPGTVGEGAAPTRNAGTMTPPRFAVRGLLESEDVVWTSVPLGKAKNFQWSLMPCLPRSDRNDRLEFQEAEERHRIRAGFDRILEILDRAERNAARRRARTLPPQVLAGTAPGIPWPSISPSAWTRIGGGLELGRLRSEPLATALRAQLHDSGGSEDQLCLEDSDNDSAAAASEEPADADETPPPLLAPPADASCEQEVSTANTAASLAAVGKSLAIVPASPDSDRLARLAQRARSRERPLPLPAAEPEEAAVQEPEPQPESPIEERFVTAVATEPCESRGVRKAHFRRRLSQPEESQQDPESCEVVERWLEMLRRPLPMVQKLEASLAEDTARSPERRRSTLSLPSSRSLTMPVRKTNTELVNDDDDLNKEELQQHWLRLVSPSNMSPSPGVTGLSPTRWLTPSLPSRPSTARPGSRPASARPGSGPRRLFGAYGALAGQRTPGRQSSGTPPRRVKGQEARPASAPIASEVESIPRAPSLLPRSRLRRFGRPSTPVRRGPKQEGCLHMAYVLHRPLSATATISY